MKGSQENIEGAGVHLVYKDLGETPFEALKKFKEKNPELKDVSVTYAGRLDPLAEGLLVLLSGEKVNEKEKYTELTKVYEFEALWGFETDTLDLLGLVTGKSDGLIVKEDKIQEYIKKSVGKFEQDYPIYSSRPVNGKPLLTWAREGKISEIQIPKHEVELISGELLSRREISKGELREEIFRRINLVNGDFRQKEILEKWSDVLGASKDTFVLDKFRAEVSGGFYVRQFANDLAKKFNTLAVTFHIKRIQIGDFKI